jgi:hypothetical protein
VRRLGLLLCVAVPAAALAKPAVWRPHNADSETAATAATAHLAAAIRAKNLSGISAILGTSFTNNGLWFPDPTCAKKFERSGLVKGADVGAFARCLSQLKVQPTTRRAALRDGGLLTVDPGIEIELAFRGDTLRYIGFPMQSGADRAIPMLTAQALEALRTAGTTLLDAKVSAALDLELARQRVPVLTAWVKLCLDPKGKITRLSTPSSSSTATSEAFLAAIDDWKFQPFEVRGTPQSACAVALLAYPGAKAPAVEAYPSSTAPAVAITRSFDFDDDDLDIYGGLIGPPPPPPPPPPPTAPLTVPPTQLEALRIAGSKTIAPAADTRADMISAGKTRVVASLKLCLDDKGSVSSTTTLKSSGFPAYDRKINAEMRRWIFKPYKLNGRAVPVCTAVTFIFDASRP